MLSEFDIGKKTLGKNNPIFIIAEIGINHNGDIDLAKKLIDVAHDAGADAVKFQSFVAENLATRTADAASYQKNGNSKLKQQEILKKVELDFEQLQILKSYAEKNDLVFLSTPFDLESFEMLSRLDLDAYKISSGDLTNYVLLNKIAKSNKPILLSSGMANLEEIREAVQWIQDTGCHSFGIMQCTSCYPTDHTDCNLTVIHTLQTIFNVPIGFSDHTVDSTAAMVSIGMGAKFLEKHITLDRTMDGPDHHMSMDPKSFRDYVRVIREAEKTLGDGIKQTLPCEQEVKELGRKSIVSKKFLPKNHIITNDDLDIKRPGTGILPKHFNKLIGKKIKFDFPEDHILTWDDIE